MSDVQGEIQGMAVAPPAKCKICQATRAVHTDLESKGELHHQFSERGELVHIQPDQKKPRVVATPDLVLRLALLDAGIITEGQLTVSEAKLRASISSGGGRGDPPDRGHRSSQGT